MGALISGFLHRLSPGPQPTNPLFVQESYIGMPYQAVGAAIAAAGYTVSYMPVKPDDIFHITSVPRYPGYVTVIYNAETQQTTAVLS
jgi:hypothetical protein